VVTVGTCVTWFIIKAHSVYLYGLFGSQNSQHLFPYTALAQKKKIEHNLYVWYRYYGTKQMAGACTMLWLSTDRRRRILIWYDMIYDMIYLLTAIGLPPGGSCTVHIYTNSTQNDTKQTIHRTTQQFWEQHKSFGRVRAVPRLGELYPGICLTTGKKHGKSSVRIAEQ
jgi:hypothetical protein